MSARTWKQSVVSLPAVGFSLVPKVICPVCSPAYAAVVSSLGLGFLISTKYVLPLTLILLSFAVGSLGFRASSRRGLGPFWMGVAAAGGILIGKFAYDSVITTYSGVGLLVVASVWNAIPQRTFCPACLPTEGALTK